MIDHGAWEGYKPEVYPKDVPEGIIFARRVSDGADWYDYVKSGIFLQNTLKLLISTSEEGDIVRVPVVEAHRMFPAGCRVIELPDVKRLQDESALIDEFANRIFDLKTGHIGELWQPKPQVDIIGQKLDDILQRLERLERKT